MQPKLDEKVRNVHIPDPASVPCLVDSFAVEWVPEQAMAQAQALALELE